MNRSSSVIVDVNMMLPAFGRELGLAANVVTMNQWNYCSSTNSNSGSRLEHKTVLPAKKIASSTSPFLAKCRDGRQITIEMGESIIEWSVSGDVTNESNNE